MRGVLSRPALSTHRTKSQVERARWNARPDEQSEGWSDLDRPVKWREGGGERRMGWTGDVTDRKFNSALIQKECFFSYFFFDEKIPSNLSLIPEPLGLLRDIKRRSLYGIAVVNRPNPDCAKWIGLHLGKG